MYNRITVVGVGGVGSNLAGPLARLLSYTKKEGQQPYELVFIDGDHVEKKNLVRQDFILKDVGLSKAEAIIGALNVDGVNPSFEAAYVNEDNVAKYITDRSIVILGVDNETSKHIVQEHCRTLDNVIMISGGNDTYDGDVSVYFKKDGVELTPPIWHDQPQIETPETDDHPERVPCGEQYEDDPQLFATNFTVAANILDVLTPVLINGEPLIQRLFFDIRTGNRAITWTKDYLDVIATSLKKKESK